MNALLVATLILACLQDGKPEPGAHHKHLKMEDGTWDVKGKMFMGEKPVDFKAVEINELVCGGLWLHSSFKGSMGAMGQFQGQGLMGYDPAKKKYVGSWVDSFSTYIGKLEGSCSDDGKVRTMFTQGPDMTGKVSRYKQVTEWKDKNHKKFTMSIEKKSGRSRSWETIMILEYTKRKTR